MRTVSTQAKVAQVHALVGTADLSSWETEFVKTMAHRTAKNMPLTEKQLEVLDRLWAKHFA